MCGKSVLVCSIYIELPMYEPNIHTSCEFKFSLYSGKKGFYPFGFPHSIILLDTVCQSVIKSRSWVCNAGHFQMCFISCVVWFAVFVYINHDSEWDDICNTRWKRHLKNVYKKRDQFKGNLFHCLCNVRLKLV